MKYKVLNLKFLKSGLRYQLVNLSKIMLCTKLKVLGAQNLDFPPKMSKTSNGHSMPSFEATPFKFGENSFFPQL